MVLGTSVDKKAKFIEKVKVEWVEDWDLLIQTGVAPGHRYVYQCIDKAGRFLVEK